MMSCGALCCVNFVKLLFFFLLLEFDSYCFVCSFLKSFARKNYISLMVFFAFWALKQSLVHQSKTELNATFIVIRYLFKFTKRNDFWITTWWIISCCKSILVKLTIVKIAQNRYKEDSFWSFNDLKNCFECLWPNFF